MPRLILDLDLYDDELPPGPPDGWNLVAVARQALAPGGRPDRRVAATFAPDPDAGWVSHHQPAGRTVRVPEDMADSVCPRCGVEPIGWHVVDGEDRWGEWHHRPGVDPTDAALCGVCWRTVAGYVAEAASRQAWGTVDEQHPEAVVWATVDEPGPTERTFRRGGES